MVTGHIMLQQWLHSNVLSDAGKYILQLYVCLCVHGCYIQHE